MFQHWDMFQYWCMFQSVAHISSLCVQRLIYVLWVLATFSDMDWPLLEAQLLRAPFTPDPQVVYAKDRILPLSNDGVKKKVSKGKMPLSPTDPRSIEVDEDGIGYRV